jgi:hypothetical protein
VISRFEAKTDNADNDQADPNYQQTDETRALHRNDLWTGNAGCCGRRRRQVLGENSHPPTEEFAQLLTN